MHIFEAIIDLLGLGGSLKKRRDSGMARAERFMAWLVLGIFIVIGGSVLIAMLW